jgi:hypothetical protein
MFTAVRSKHSSRVLKPSHKSGQSQAYLATMPPTAFSQRKEQPAASSKRRWPISSAGSRLQTIKLSIVVLYGRFE